MIVARNSRRGRGAVITGESSVAVLLQRIRENRLILQEASRRLSAASAVARQRRAVAARLRLQVRRSLERLQRSREDARTRPTPVRAPAPVFPRLTPGETDPLEARRRKLHEAYAATGDAAIRAELLSSYDGFARSLALKFRHRESVDDLVQVARIGLLHAIDRFDPELGRPFPLFARITIIGELKRHLRDKTWSMRVPRSLQEDYLVVMRAVDELTAEQSDSPSMEALAERCGMSLERVIEALDLRVGRRTLSVDGPPAAGADDPGLDLGREDTAFRQLEDRELLTQLLSRLPERDRRIVELRFIGELTQAEIATQVGVSQMCVSRVLARTLGRLRLWARAAVG